MGEPPRLHAGVTMTPDWTAIRLDLLQIDDPMRATLREMRPFFAKSLPAILARFYDKVRHYDPVLRHLQGRQRCRRRSACS